MPYPRILLSLRLITFLILMLPVFGAKGDWLLFESPHFVLLTKDASKAVPEILIKAEAFHAAFTQSSGFASKAPTKTLFVSTSTRDLADIGKVMGLGDTNDGPILKNENESTLVFVSGDIANGANRMEALNHVLSSSIVLNCTTTSDPWLSRGIGKVYENTEYRGEHLRIGVESRDDLNLLRRPSERLPLEQVLTNTELLASSNMSSGFFSGSRDEMGDARAQSKLSRQASAKAWLFCHYCLFVEPAKYRDKLVAFSKQIGRGAAPNNALFSSCFGMSIAEMDKLLDASVPKLRTFGVKFPVNKSAETGIQQVPLSQEEASLLYRCARLRLTTSRKVSYSPYEEISAELETFPFTHPFVVTFAAAMARRADTTQTALINKLELRAIELGTSSRTPYRNQLRIFISEIGHDLDYRLPENICERLRSCADKALQLDSEDEYVKSKVLWIEAHADKPRYAVINQLQREVKTWGDSREALLCLAMIQFRGGDLDTCESILRVLREASLYPNTIRELQGRIDEARSRQVRKN